MIVGNSPSMPSELARQLINLAVNAGRTMQSSQTGYIHHYYKPSDDASCDTIPILENFLFALALIRERTAESFAEGRDLLEKLIHFQTESGNFPTYLHEYPKCSNRFILLDLLPIFYEVLHTFPLVLCPSSREQFQKMVERSLRVALELEREDLSFLPRLKLLCGLKLLASFFKDSALESRCALSLETLSKEIKLSYSLYENIGEIVVFLQLCYGEISTTCWRELWELLNSVWHPKLSCYVGPFKNRQVRDQPEVTLLDLVAGFQTGTYASRTLKNGSHLLYAALIHPSFERIEAVAPYRTKQQIAGGLWSVRSEQRWALSLLSPTEMGRESTPLKLLWGETNYTHSFVCQGGNIERAEFEEQEGGVDLILSLPKEPPEEAKQRSREVIFALNYLEGTTLTVAHSAASAFQLGEEVTIQREGAKITLSLLLEEGEGRFFGHITKGNRALQKCCTKESRFASYDWLIFLRTVERRASCRLRAKIRFIFP